MLDKLSLKKEGSKFILIFFQKLKIVVKNLTMLIIAEINNGDKYRILT